MILTYENYQLSEISKTLLRMKPVLNSAGFCNQYIVMGVLMLFTCFSSSSQIVPKAATTTGTSVALQGASQEGRTFSFFV